MDYFEDILYFMNEVEKIKCFKNSEKKGYVVEKIKERIGKEEYEKYDILIDNARES